MLVTRCQVGADRGGIPLTSQQETWWQLTSHDIGIGLQPTRASSQCSVSWGRSEAAGHCRDSLQLRRLSPVTNQHQSPLQSRSQQQRNVASTDITQKMVTWGHGSVAASLSHHVWGKYSSLHEWVNFVFVQFLILLIFSLWQPWRPDNSLYWCSHQLHLHHLHGPLNGFYFYHQEILLLLLWQILWGNITYCYLCFTFTFPSMFPVSLFIM